MTTRDKILSAIKQNQPSLVALPDIPDFSTMVIDPVEQFKAMLSEVGGENVDVSSVDEIIEAIRIKFPLAGRVVSSLPGFLRVAEPGTGNPHTLENVDIAIVKAHFGVSENGSVWVTDELLVERALPFIAQHLVVVLSLNAILPTMHDAYLRIGRSDYSFGTFIAGPSKTADIEQSLVLGAHGARTMTVFLLAGELE